MVTVGASSTGESYQRNAEESRLEKGINEIFISYSRKDKIFVQSLDTALRNIGQDPWVDWDDIQPTEDWWEAIKSGIEAASTFVFVISPDSIASQVCREEVDHAVSNKKRLIPIVRRDGFDTLSVHPEINRHNWLFFRETDDFDHALQTLVKAINTDLAYARDHTRLQIRALEWDKKKRNESFLLRGTDLAEAEHWLGQASGKHPEPTELQCDYIRYGRIAEITRQREEIKRHRIALVIVSFGLLAAIASAVIVWKERQESERQRINAEVTSHSWAATSFLASGLHLEAMLRALRMGRQVNRVNQSVDLSTRMRAIGTLKDVVYQVRLSNTLEGHGEYVMGIGWSPDGNLLASASGDKTVKLWNAKGKLLRTLTGHSDTVNAVSFSPDNRIIATASVDGTVRIWNSNGNLLRTLSGHQNVVNAVTFSPNGQTIATASDDGTIKLWNPQGRLLRTLNNDGNQPVYGVSFAPDGTFASASADGTVKIWNQDGRLLNTLRGHTNVVIDVAFSPDGNAIASAGGDTTVRLWSREGVLLKTLEGHTDYVKSVAFSPDGQLIASGSDDNTIKIWDRQGQELQTLRGQTNWVNGVRFSPDGKTLASAGADRTVKLWHLAGVPLVKLQHPGYLFSTSFSPDGQLIASASNDKALGLWQVRLWERTGKLLQTFIGHEGTIYGVSFSPDGQTIATASLDKTVRLWTLKGQLLTTLKGHGGAVTAVRFSPDGKTIVTASDDQTVRLWSRDGKALSVIGGHNSIVWDVAFSPDGQLIASAGGDKTVKLWTRDGQWLKTLTGHGAVVNSVSFSPDGRFLASASDDSRIKLWNLTTPNWWERIGREPPEFGQELRTLKGHSGRVLAVSFSPDGETLASAGDDNTVRLWSRNGQDLNTIFGHVDKTTTVSFSPDGLLLASGSNDKSVILWNLNLDNLLERGCNWVGDYLQTNNSLSDVDRQLCHGI